MSYPRLATRLYDAPLLLNPAKAELIERVFRAHHEGRAALLSPAEPQPPRQELEAPGMAKTDGGYYRTSTGIALIPIVGTLVQRGDAMDATSGLVGYNRIAAQLQAAIDDPRVSAILLEIDSNGGEAAGVIDLAAKIRQANERKPTWAVANEQAFSAAYWLASAAGRIAVPESGMVGSVGVVMLHVDQSAKDAKAGVTYTPIYAGARKVDFSSHAPLSDAAFQVAQDEVDRLYDLFVTAVAEHRGMDQQAVRATEAGLYHAKAALDIGMIDAVEPFDATLMALAIEAQRFRMQGPRAASAISRGVDMSTQSTTAPAAALPNAAVEQQISEARTTAKAEGMSEGAKSGAEAERARIAGILGHAEAAERRTLAEHLAFKTSHSVEEAVALLVVSAKEAPGKPMNQLAAAMPPNPRVAADTGADDAPKKAQISASKIYEQRRLAAVK